MHDQHDHRPGARGARLADFLSNAVNVGVVTRPLVGVEHGGESGRADVNGG
jgi:hypothetical protein